MQSEIYNLEPHTTLGSLREGVPESYPVYVF